MTTHLGVVPRVSHLAALASLAVGFALCSSAEARQVVIDMPPPTAPAEEAPSVLEEMPQADAEVGELALQRYRYARNPPLYTDDLVPFYPGIRAIPSYWWFWPGHRFSFGFPVWWGRPIIVNPVPRHMR